MQFVMVVLLNFSYLKIQKKGSHFSITSFSVPGAGLEPARPNGHKILSLACLPIPPPGQIP